ncbi:MAG TPA: aminotransferase class I/II-fold pyridoxal phosphate-dependent enzyme [Gemmatimonadales bacterium]|nr:aminotransferase class I/II-fold pyridoxal phosphate-dependent enzyme [Gemmatimonadales bacterium]
MSGFDVSRSHLCARAIHGGLWPDPATGAILTPIYQTTTFRHEAVGVHKGYTYTRSANPTVAALERNLGALEEALPAASFATGMAALAALFLATLEHGDRVVVSDVIYGGTVRLLRRVLGAFGVVTEAVNTADADELREALRARTRLVVIESPANPTLKLTDLALAASLAHEAGAVVAVDNTVLTPVLQSPLDLGADVVVHSTTKYIEGHNATVGGALLTRDEKLLERIRFVQNAVGFPQAPFEAWLTLRGIKTLPLRMARHSATALMVAQWLERQPGVRRVAYPFLDSFPQRDLALRQQRAGGGLVTFELDGGEATGIRLLNSVRLCALAENLGAVETLVTHPVTMTHASLTPEEREAAGIGGGLVRLSVGLEEPEAIIEDLDQALRAAVRA